MSTIFNRSTLGAFRESRLRARNWYGAKAPLLIGLRDPGWPFYGYDNAELIFIRSNRLTSLSLPPGWSMGKCGIFLDRVAGSLAWRLSRVENGSGDEWIYTIKAADAEPYLGTVAVTRPQDGSYIDRPRIIQRVWKSGAITDILFTEMALEDYEGHTPQSSGGGGHHAPLPLASTLALQEDFAQYNNVGRSVGQSRSLYRVSLDLQDFDSVLGGNPIAIDLYPAGGLHYGDRFFLDYGDSSAFLPYGVFDYYPSKPFAYYTEEVVRINGVHQGFSIGYVAFWREDFSITARTVHPSRYSLSGWLNPGVIDDFNQATTAQLPIDYGSSAQGRAPYDLFDFEGVVEIYRVFSRSTLGDDNLIGPVPWWPVERADDPGGPGVNQDGGWLEPLDPYGGEPFSTRFYGGQLKINTDFRYGAPSGFVKDLETGSDMPPLGIRIKDRVQVGIVLAPNPDTLVTFRIDSPGRAAPIAKLNHLVWQVTQAQKLSPPSAASRSIASEIRSYPGFKPGGPGGDGPGGSFEFGRYDHDPSYENEGEAYGSVAVRIPPPSIPNLVFDSILDSRDGVPVQISPSRQMRSDVYFPVLDWDFNDPTDCP